MAAPSGRAATAAFARSIGVDHPIVQAPMAGGATTPELVSAVSNAGALGSLAAAILPPEAIVEAAAAVRARTSRPFNVNLFVLDEPRTGDPALAAGIARAIALLAPLRAELGLPPQSSPAKFCESPSAQLAALRDVAPAVASFTFGVLPSAEVRAIKARGSFVVGTATHVAEARAWEDAGADAVCAQGAEAGAHRGTFIGPPDDAMIGTLALVPQIADAVRIPVIAAGGIMDGRGIAASLRLGAVGAQLGTAFLTCPEAGVHPEWKRLLRSPEATRTVVTRSFSGRAARAMVNRYVEHMHGHQNELPAYPVMNALTAELRAFAGKLDRAEYMSLWAGQGAALSRGLPAAELVQRLVDELAQLEQAWRED